MNGIDLIRQERQRQEQEEGYTPALPILPDLVHRLYPWRFKPAGDRIHDLAKAGALIAAEIDRLQRVKAEEAPNE